MKRGGLARRIKLCGPPGLAAHLYMDHCGMRWSCSYNQGFVGFCLTERSMTAWNLRRHLLLISQSLDSHASLNKLKPRILICKYKQAPFWSSHNGSLVAQQGGQGSAYCSAEPLCRPNTVTCCLPALEHDKSSTLPFLQLLSVDFPDESLWQYMCSICVQYVSDWSAQQRQL